MTWTTTARGDLPRRVPLRRTSEEGSPRLTALALVASTPSWTPWVPREARTFRTPCFLVAFSGPLGPWQTPF